jgi:LuxR family transcriptional regulator, maltose regulon positive regulatory protein
MGTSTSAVASDATFAGPASADPVGAIRAEADDTSAAPRPRSAIPELTGQLLRRPRLEQRIRAGAAKHLLLVSGPAGQGKSTAVAEALRELSSVAWVTLDEADRSPWRLQDHILVALDDATGHLLDLGAPTDGPDSPLARAGQRFADLDHDVVLVLDDPAGALRGASAGLVGRLLDRSTDHLHVVVLSRDRPALDIERRRSRGEVAEVAADELAFTDSEAETYLNEVWGLGLPPDAVHELMTLTDAWPVALRLVAAHLAHAPDTAQGDQLTATVDRATRRLVRESMEALGSDDRRFLLDIAVLDELEPAVCERVTGRSAGAERLDGLAGIGLVRRTGPTEDTFVHRGLVRPYLLEELRAGAPGRATALHEVAAALFAAGDRWTSAIEHALAARDERQALTWLESNLEELVAVEDGAWFDRMLGRVSPTALGRRPSLLRARLDLALARGDRDALEHTLASMEDPTLDGAGRSDALRRARAYLSRLRGDGVEPLLVNRDHRSLDPETAHPLGVALAAEGRHDAASAAFRCAIDDARRRDEPLRELALLGDVAWQRATAGYLVAADLLTRKAMELASRLGLRAPPLHALLAGAQIALDRGRIDAAHDQAATVRAVASESLDLVLLVDTGLFVSRARWARDDLDGATRALDETDRHLREHMPGGGLISRLIRARASMFLALDDPYGAIALLPAITGEVDDLPPEDRLIAGLVHLKLGDPRQARRSIESLAQAGVGPRLTVHALRIEAAALGMSGETAEATRLRRQADRIARVAGLLTPVVHRRVPRPDRGLRESPDGSPSGAAEGTLTAPIEGMTQRELDVLRMLPAASNLEIATDLYMSVNTVKTHLKSIYRKLGVASREAAVQQARAVGLL